MKEVSKYLFDSNVIIDALTARKGSANYCRDLLRFVANGNIKGYLCSKQITDIYYVLRKYIEDDSTRRRIIKTLLDNFEILALLKSELTFSLNVDNNDYEDALLSEVANINCLNIITSNVKDFKNHKRLVFTPDQAWGIEKDNNKTMSV